MLYEFASLSCILKHYKGVGYFNDVEVLAVITSYRRCYDKTFWKWNEYYPESRSVLWRYIRLTWLIVRYQLTSQSLITFTRVFEKSSILFSTRNKDQSKSSAYLVTDNLEINFGITVLRDRFPLHQIYIALDNRSLCYIGRVCGPGNR